MPKLSSAAWVAHDLGLAAAVGGALFGKTALSPAVHQLRNAKWREKVNEDAWSRYSPIMLAAHAAVAVPWIVGRTMLTGKEAGGTARSLTRAKDILVGVGVVTAIANVVIGKLMQRRHERARSAEEVGAANAVPDNQPSEHTGLETVAALVGTVNMVANAAVMGVTSVLAMEGSESGRFALTSRTLP